MAVRGLDELLTHVVAVLAEAEVEKDPGTNGIFSEIPGEVEEVVLPILVIGNNAETPKERRDVYARF